MPKETNLSLSQILELFNVSPEDWTALQKLDAEGKSLPETDSLFYKLILVPLLNASESDTFSLLFINEMEEKLSHLDIKKPLAPELAADLEDKYIYTGMLPRNLMAALVRSKKPFVVILNDGQPVIGAEGLARTSIQELLTIEEIGQRSIHRLIQALKVRAQLPIEATSLPSQTLLSDEEIPQLYGRFLTKNKVDGTVFPQLLIAKLRNTVPKAYYSISYEVSKNGEERFDAHFLASQTTDWYKEHRFLNKTLS